MELLDIIIRPIVLLILVIIFSSFTYYLWWKMKKTEKNRELLELKYNQLENDAGQMKLGNLESKLNPHLFKNILNSIQSHAYQTYFALDKMSNVLDYILYDSSKKFVTPKEEIEFALNLVEINKIKLSPLFELKVKMKVNENEHLYTQKLMAPLISIDLIENAFKHADLQKSDSFIDITFQLKDNVFALTVANSVSSKVPLEKPHSGIGNATLEQRLDIIYKDVYKLDRFIENEVYIAHLKINLLEHKAKMLAARR
ncbi:MAG: histidine kinase [Cyclobacteriaceae bacterium]|nr:histidine kinase [Cyclobacteriaceae bacterium]